MTARDTEVKFLTAAVNCQPVCIAVAQMRPTATNVARSVVCVFVCVGNTGEPYRNG